MLTAVAALLVLCAAFANGCTIAGLSGSLAIKPFKAQDPSAYTLTGTIEALKGYGGFTGQWVNNTQVRRAGHANQ
jgi:hypothetical protein